MSEYVPYLKYTNAIQINWKFLSE